MNIAEENYFYTIKLYHYRQRMAICVPAVCEAKETYFTIKIKHCIYIITILNRDYIQYQRKKNNLIRKKADEKIGFPI